MSETKLLNCPFCGGKARFCRLSEKQKDGYTDCVFVRCKDCYASTKKIEYNARIHKNDSEYDEAKQLWNTRKPMERIVERLEELEERSMFPDDDDYICGQYDAFTECKKIVKEEGGFDV